MNAGVSGMVRYLLPSMVLPVLLLFAPMSRAAESGELYSSINAEQLLEMFKDEGYSASLDKDNNIRWKLEGRNCLVLFYSNNSAIQFYYGVSGTAVTAEQINAWNTGKRFSRAYLDSDGDPCLELDLDLEGGVSRARIVDFLATCRVSFTAWEREVIHR